MSSYLLLGQASKSSSSEIYNILDEYFQILNYLRKTEIPITEDISRLKSGTTGIDTTTTKEDAIIITSPKISIVKTEGSGGGSYKQFPSTPGEGSDGSISSDECSIESSYSGSNFTSANVTAQNSANPLSLNETVAYTWRDLDSSFIRRILEEPELLNELVKQSGKLVDFICYGYFYRNVNGEGVKVPHLEYLVDEMLKCCDKYQLEVPGAPQANRPYNVFDTADHKEHVVGDVDIDIDAELDENTKILNRATLISEILALDVWLINDALIKNTTYLDKVWSLVRHPNFNSESSPLVLIFLKINQSLFFARQDEYLRYIGSKYETLVDEILAHVNVTLMIDFLLKLLSTDKPENPTGIIDLLNDQRLIQKCLNFFDNEKYSSDIQNCVGDFLKAIITISANAQIDEFSIGPNSLTRELASLESVRRIVDTMVTQRGTALNVLVSIIIELIRKNNSDYDQVNLLNTTIKDNVPSDRDPIYLGYMLRTFTENLPRLFSIVTDVDTDETILARENQLGEYFRPLGSKRFRVVELIAELLHCSNMGLMNSKRVAKVALRRDKYRLKIHNQKLKRRQLQRRRAEESRQEKLGRKLGDGSPGSIHATKQFGDLCLAPTGPRGTAHFQLGRDDADRIGDHTDDDDEAKRDNDIDIALEEPCETIGDISDEEDNGSELDETFDIPYVNQKQNDKLRCRPTIGDAYKIALYDQQIVPKLLVLFLQYPWNNFWHSVIFDIIQQLFNGRMDFSYNSFLVYSLFDTASTVQFFEKDFTPLKDGIDVSNFKITKDFILKGYEDSYDFFNKRHTNLGFMGHLVLIAEEVVKFSRLYKVELISPFIQDTIQDKDWRYYVEEVLNEIRLMYSKILGGGSYVEDGNGNIVPQLPESGTGGNMVNVEELELQLATESDLHDKLRNMLTMRSQNEVDEENRKKGVIILGPPSDE